MADRARIYALTGDDVVAFGLDGTRAGAAQSLLPGTAARCIAVDPLDPSRVYVGTFNDGLLASEDGCATWRPDGDGLIDRRVMSVAVSPVEPASGMGVVFAGTEPSNLYRSEDAGRSWQLLPALRELPSEPGWSFPPRPWTHHVSTIAPHPSDPNWLAVGIELGGVMRTLDGGSSWIDHNPQAYSDAHQLLTHPLAPHRLYEAAGQGIALTDDLGQRWDHRDRGLDRHYAWAQAIDPADPDLWYVSISRGPYAAHGQSDGQSQLLRSRGNGWSAIDTWENAPALRRMPYALATLPDQPGRLLVALRGGAFLVTDDAGESWIQLALQLPDVIALAAASA
jgi:photosystem II stability/assembly factor-like uncharacterized protein